MILAWSNEEAGRYLETFKAFEHKTADAIKPRTGDTKLDRLSTVLSNVRSVNKTDCLTLSTQFKSVADILTAEESSLRICSGFGDQKIRRFLEATGTGFDPTVYKD
jgi:DNA excision repair protein ERCC-1